MITYYDDDDVVLCWMNVWVGFFSVLAENEESKVIRIIMSRFPTFPTCLCL